MALAKSATFIASAFTEIRPGFDLSVLFPNAPSSEQSAEDIERELAKCQGVQSEP